MNLQISVQVTPQGLLISHTAIQDWLQRGLEITQEGERIIIQPKPLPLTERDQVQQILEKANLLVKPEPLPSDFKPLSAEEQTELARKFGEGQPLSELVIKERQSGW